MDRGKIIKWHFKIVVGIVLFFIVVNLNAQFKIVNQCGKGLLLEQDGQKILVLRGSPYEMGYQHGVLLKEEVRTMVELSLMVAFARNPGALEKAWNAAKSFIPDRYLEELRGLSDGAGIPLEKVQYASVFPELFHCSGMVFWGKATKNSKLLHCRILDYATEIGLQKYAVVMFFQPDNYYSFISAGFAGFIGCVTGMNNQKIAIGEMGGRGEGQWSGIPMTFLMRMVMEEADSLEKGVNIFQKNPRTCEYYYVISDAKIPDARGLYCTPEKMEILKPGENHSALPSPPPPDTLLITGKDRYPSLLERVQKYYGNIDKDILIEIMKRPVSMKSNLHNAILFPEEDKMWLAIAKTPENKDFQACNQPYIEYDIKKLKDYLEKLTPAVKKEISEEKGILKSSSIAPLKDDADERINESLKIFNIPIINDISYTLKPVIENSDFIMWELKFPSVVNSPFPENNLVVCEYYQSKNTEQNKKPAVIILDISEGSLFAARLIAYRLALEKINCLIVNLPYHGPRKPIDFKNDLNILLQGVIQAISDIRVAEAWLKNREENNADHIGICGISLGGITASLAAGITGDFPKAAFLLSGGDLLSIIKQNSKEIKTYEKIISQQKFLEDELQKMLIPFTPLTYVKRISKTDILMVNMENDSVVPQFSAKKYAEALPKVRTVWYPGDHYDIIFYIPEIFDLLVHHFKSDSW